MEETYNWNLITMVAGPIAVIEAIIFYLGISNGWKWLSLVIGILVTFIIIYAKDKAKNNIFTAVGVVFLVALITKFLKDFGLL